MPHSTLCRCPHKLLYRDISEQSTRKRGGKKEITSKLRTYSDVSIAYEVMSKENVVNKKPICKMSLILYIHTFDFYAGYAIALIRLHSTHTVQAVDRDHP